MLIACAHAPVMPTCPPSPVRVVIERCLTQQPPEPPQISDDPAINAARQSEAYDALALWVYLYAWPNCKE